MEKNFGYIFFFFIIVAQIKGQNLLRADSVRIIRDNKEIPNIKYKRESVQFESGLKGVFLSAELLLPENFDKTSPLVIFTAPPQNFVNKNYFNDIAEHLASKGIASLRYDNRSFTNKDLYNNDTATMAVNVEDTKKAYSFLRAKQRFRLNPIGLIGHSEGSLVASIVATELADLSFLVLFAIPLDTNTPFYNVVSNINPYFGVGMYADAPIVGNPEATFHDRRRTLLLYYRILDLMAKGWSNEQIRNKIIEEKIYFKLKEDLPANIISERVNAWMKYNADKTFARINIPILGIFAEKDLKVNTAQSIINIERLTVKYHLNTDITLVKDVGHNLINIKNPEINKKMSWLMKDLYMWIKEKTK